MILLPPYLILISPSLAINYSSSSSLFNYSYSDCSLISWDPFFPLCSWSYLFQQILTTLPSCLWQFSGFFHCSQDKAKLLTWCMKGLPYLAPCFQLMLPHTPTPSLCTAPSSHWFYTHEVPSTWNVLLILPHSQLLFFLLFLAQLSLPQRHLCSLV